MWHFRHSMTSDSRSHKESAEASINSRGFNCLITEDSKTSSKAIIKSDGCPRIRRKSSWQTSASAVFHGGRNQTLHRRQTLITAPSRCCTPAEQRRLLRLDRCGAIRPSRLVVILRCATWHNLVASKLAFAVTWFVGDFQPPPAILNDAPACCAPSPLRPGWKIGRRPKWGQLLGYRGAIAERRGSHGKAAEYPFDHH